MKKHLLPTLKMTLAAILTILLANVLSLKYAATAGVISLLSIQSTKRESFYMAYKRIAISVFGLLLSSFLFWILGFEVYVFGLFLLVFIPLAYLFKMSEGIVVASVLVTHVLIEENFHILINEFAILIIPVTVALFINLYMPNSEKTLMQKEAQIDQMIGAFLSDLSSSLQNRRLDLKSKYTKIDTLIKETMKVAQAYQSNLLFNNATYHLNYLFMRSTQLQYLKRITDYLIRITNTYPVTLQIASFTDALSHDIGYVDKATPRLEELKQMREGMKTMALPIDREEFENRAMLYQVLNELEEFLEVKIAFHLNNDIYIDHIKKNV